MKEVGYNLVWMLLRLAFALVAVVALVVALVIPLHPDFSQSKRATACAMAAAIALSYAAWTYRSVAAKRRHARQREMVHLATVDAVDQLLPSGGRRFDYLRWLHRANAAAIFARSSAPVDIYVPGRRS
jgi:hypothetical protein